VTADRETDYIVEFVALGNSVKATAVDPLTLKEATVIGSRKTTKEQLAELAVRKLRYLIEKDGG
jgi:hypothetical protein